MYTSYFGTMKYLRYINYTVLFRLFQPPYVNSLEDKIVRPRL